MCCRSKKGTEERAAANKKGRAYYKTGAGLEMKKACREKQILNQLTMLDLSKKAHLCHETIEKLVKML